MKIKRTAKGLISINNLSIFFLILWLICVIGVLTMITMATNGFTTQASETTVGQSSFWIPVFLLLFLTGCAAFGGLIICMTTLLIRKLLSLKTSEKREGKTVRSLVKSLLVSAVMILMLLIGYCLGLGQKSEFKQTPAPVPIPLPSPTPKPIQTIPKPQSQPVQRKTTFSGPELWEVVNKRRVENGVGRLERNDEICSIASFRLNQLLERGSLDNHAGFNELWQNESSQYYWIFQKYDIWEYIVYVPSGTAETAADWWENTLGHKTLLDGGQFTIGCTYAQNGFGVAIAAF